MDPLPDVHNGGRCGSCPSNTVRLVCTLPAIWGNGARGRGVAVHSLPALVPSEDATRASAPAATGLGTLTTSFACAGSMVAPEGVEALTSCGNSEVSALSVVSARLPRPLASANRALPLAAREEVRGGDVLVRIFSSDITLDDGSTARIFSGTAPNPVSHGLICASRVLDAGR